MTGPIPIMPAMPTGGNLLLDLSRAGAGLAQGSMAMRKQQREEALAQALATARLLQAQQGERPFHIVVQTPTGLQHKLVGATGKEVPLAPELQTAPESQFYFPTETPSGELGYGAASRYRPGATAQPVPMPAGMQPRQEAPVVGQMETPGGPVVTRTPRRGGQAEVVSGPGGAPMQPKAQEHELRKARDAFEMIQGYHGMQQAAQSAPGEDVYDSVAKFWAAQSIAEGIPLVGKTAQSIIQTAQNVLSPAASQYFTSLMNFAAARAFSRGGATLTKNEIDYALSAHAPRIGDPENVRAQKDEFTRGAIEGAIRGSGSAWQRFAPEAAQFGWHLNPITPSGVTPTGKYDKFLGTP